MMTYKEDHIKLLPAISVVMPVYNDAAYLHQAIDSILNQRFNEFEFIIVNDGSTDHTEEIILSYNDERILYLRNEENKGCSYSRSKGMKAARGKYIAAMDGDDISSPDRLKLQYEYLETHPEIGFLGGDLVYFFKDSWYRHRFFTDPDYIKSFSFFQNTIGSATVMMRRSEVEKHQLYYDPEYENGEDFELFYRALMAGVKISSINELIYYYRQSDNQLSSPHNLAPRKRNTMKYLEGKLVFLGIELAEHDFLIFNHFINDRVALSKADYELVYHVLERIKNANNQKLIFHSHSFNAVILGQKFRLIKFYYLDNRKYSGFLAALITLVLGARLKDLILFWNNEGKNLSRKMHRGSPPGIFL